VPNTTTPAAGPTFIENTVQAQDSRRQQALAIPGNFKQCENADAHVMPPSPRSPLRSHPRLLSHTPHLSMNDDRSANATTLTEQTLDTEPTGASVGRSPTAFSLGHQSVCSSSDVTETMVDPILFEFHHSNRKQFGPATTEATSDASSSTNSSEV
jgi:hypothetical protein